jgi:hypothetical protein
MMPRKCLLLGAAVGFQARRSLRQPPADTPHVRPSPLLQGGAAVQGLAALAPWFGSGVVANETTYCVTGLELSYEPLQVRFAAGQAKLQHRVPPPPWQP